MIFNCTSKGNALPNGLSSGSTSPWYFMLTGKASMWPLRSVPPYSSVPWTNRLLVPGQKRVPMGGTPYRFLSVTSSPRDPSPPIRFSGGLSKTSGAPSLWLIPLCSVKLFKMEMVSSLVEALVLYSVPLAVVFDLLQAVWNLPLRKACVSALFRRSSTDEFRDLAKQFPWDHPIARTLDHEVHRRRMAGKSYRLFYRPVWGSFPPSQPFLFLVCRRVSQSRFSSASPVAHPPLPLPSTSQIKLGGTFFGSQNVRVDVFLRILDHPGRPTCLSHLPVGSPPHPWFCLQSLRAHDGWIENR